jgi:hypothetical protein
VPTRTRSVALSLTALIVAAQGVATLALGLGLMIQSVVGNPDSRAAAMLIGVLSLLGGAGLVLCSWGLQRGRRWSRAPALVWLLLMVPVGWYQVQGGLRWVGLPLTLLSALGILLLLIPASTEALRD